MNVAEREAKIAALRRELRLLSDATSRREAVRDEIAVLEAQRAMPTRRRPEEEDSVRYGRHELEPDKPRIRRLVVMEPLDGLLEIVGREKPGSWDEGSIGAAVEEISQATPGNLGGPAEGGGVQPQETEPAWNDELEAARLRGLKIAKERADAS